MELSANAIFKLSYIQLTYEIHSFLFIVSLEMKYKEIINETVIPGKYDITLKFFDCEKGFLTHHHNT